MAKVIQIRDVPDDVHDALVIQAEARGLSLTKFLLGNWSTWPDGLRRPPTTSGSSGRSRRRSRAR